MTKDSEYIIPSARFAQICGTTRDTLRYYEKQKILVPWKDPDNGYRYYSYAQIGSFYFISTLRGVDVSTDQISSYLQLGSQKTFLPYITVQLDALKKERREIDNKIRQLAGALVIGSIVRYEEYGTPVVRICPADVQFRVAPVSSDHACSLRDIAQDIQKHIHLFPDMAKAFPAGTAMSAEGFLNGDYRYIKVISLVHSDEYDLRKAEGAPGGSSENQPSARSLSQEAEDQPAPGSIEAWDSVTTFALPTRKIAVIACRDTDGDIRVIYRRLADFIQKNHIPMLTDVFSLSLVNVVDPSQERRYLKYIFVSTSDDVPVTPPVGQCSGTAAPPDLPPLL